MNQYVQYGIEKCAKVDIGVYMMLTSSQAPLPPPSLSILLLHSVVVVSGSIRDARIFMQIVARTHQSPCQSTATRCVLGIRRLSRVSQFSSATHSHAHRSFWHDALSAGCETNERQCDWVVTSKSHAKNQKETQPWPSSPCPIVWQPVHD